MAKSFSPVGIDDLACYLPPLFLDLRDLAAPRGIPAEKLSAGLGLLQMAIPDAGEDAATMAAEAVSELLVRNNLNPATIGRLYLGTESALDQAKPTATYILHMLERRFEAQFGARSFRHCDALDMTFACIGAVDALQNALDWVAANPGQVAVVIASDIARYELESSGEYTQGAGAVAMLIKHNPRLLVVRRIFGVATESVHDFFKPRRERYTDTPVFDGQYSNQCYQNRMVEAFQHFRELCEKAGVWLPGQWPALTDRWARLIFHLPYAFHARRIITEWYIAEQKAKGKWEAEARKLKLPADAAVARPLVKAVAESRTFQRWISDKIEKGERASQHTGNLYTASIFLALMSTLEADCEEGTRLAGKRLGFVAYGSGSKAKVFEAVVQPGWESVAASFGLNQKITDRVQISYPVYLDLHTGKQDVSVVDQPGKWRLEAIGGEGFLPGTRHYHEM